MKKYSFDDLVNKRNQVNWELFDKIQFEFFSKDAKYNLKNRPEKHSGEKFTWDHIENVVKSAKKISLPLGVKRRNLIFAAIFHDIGKPYRNDDHGADSAKVMDKLFKKNKDFELIRLAVKYHMLNPSHSKKDYKKMITESIKKNIPPKKCVKLLLALKKSDILRGRKGSDNDDLFNQPLNKTIKEESKIQRKIFKEIIKESMSK